MRYIFDGFEFDSVSLVLRQHGDPVDIRHNEARVLALLLEQPETVLSKDDILSHVWQGKIVSEQAVFQNISHLRSLLGNGAIKTFPKRGYQWQLPTQCIAAASGDDSPIPPQVTDTPLPKPWPRGLAAFAGIIFSLILVLGLQSGSDQKGSADVIRLAYIPVLSPQSGTGIYLDSDAHFDFTALTLMDRAHFMTSAELEYPSIAKTHPLVLTGEMHTHKQLFYLDFLLKGPFGEWQGQLMAQSQAAAMDQLRGHLQHSFLYELLNRPQPPELKLANLAIAHRQHPDDLIILGNLVRSYLVTDEADKAMVLADKLLKLATGQHNAQQMGKALLFQSEILTRKDLLDLSSQKLTLALAQFESIADLKRQADAWAAKSWLDHQRNDYQAIKSSLLSSARLAREGGDKPRELHALTYLSIMAHKHRQDTDKYLYLQQAEAKMTAYGLPVYHFAKVPFHYAIFADKPVDKEPHLKQALEYTALTPDHWVAQSSRLQLTEYYLAQNRLADARALVTGLGSDNAHNSFLKTLLARAEQDSGTFIRQAQLTFEQAQLAGERTLNLDLALLLCAETDPAIDRDFYARYIQDHATPYWRRANLDRLQTLKL